MSEELMKVEFKVEISSAHMVSYTKTKCNRLHGHNYKFEVSIWQKAEDMKGGMVIDYNEIKSIIDRLDHKLIVAQSQVMNIYNNEMHIKVADRSYVIPIDVVEVLGIYDVTAEELARYYAKEIYRIGNGEFVMVEVKVSETENVVADAVYIGEVVNAEKALSMESEE